MTSPIKYSKTSLSLQDTSIKYGMVKMLLQFKLKRKLNLTKLFLILLLLLSKNYFLSTTSIDLFHIAL